MLAGLWVRRRDTGDTTSLQASRTSRLVDLVIVAAPVDRTPRPRFLDPVDVRGLRVLDPGPPRACRSGDGRVAATRVAAPGERIVARLDRRSVAPRRRRFDRP